MNRTGAEKNHFEPAKKSNEYRTATIDRMKYGFQVATAATVVFFRTHARDMRTSSTAASITREHEENGEIDRTSNISTATTKPVSA